MPTGGGKTLTMILDTQRRHDVINNGTTTVVVAPMYFLLAEQLCSEFMEIVDGSHTSYSFMFIVVRHITSALQTLRRFTLANCARTSGENLIIFTTYNSLERIAGDIEVNTIYFDEAHNSVQRNFYPTTDILAVSQTVATSIQQPRNISHPLKPGMNDGSVYGQVLVNVPAPELVEGGYILPPKVVVKQLDIIKGQCISEKMQTT